MPHQSEGCSRLRFQNRTVIHLSEIQSCVDQVTPAAFLLWFPSGRTDSDAAESEGAFARVMEFASGLHGESIISILTSPPDAARLTALLGNKLRFQLWVAVKTRHDATTANDGELAKRHVALLVYSRYARSLDHTKTRIAYTYCAACGRTTKDYGGKKHLYHEYGTLLSDVWRDIDCDPACDISAVVDRLRDLFGLTPYRNLHLLDLRECRELQPRRATAAVAEESLAFPDVGDSIPEGSKLVRGDCLEVLRTLPDNSVDFCFADPPYNLRKKYDKWDDSLESVEYFSWCDRWLSELARVLKPGRTLAVVNIPLWAARHYQHLCSILSYQNWIVWDAIGFPVRMVMPAHYAILCFSKGPPRPLPGLDAKVAGTPDSADLQSLLDGYCARPGCMAMRRYKGMRDTELVTDLWADIHRLKHNSRRVDHPCQLPPRLMRRLIALFTQRDELVLDCFDGAGTTTLVAHQMGRRFLGIELSEQYHKLALARHKQVVRGEDPFGKRDEVPISKNSPVQRLPKQNYLVSKKTLQLEVRRIAHQLGRLPTRDEVRAMGKYQIEMYDQYFVSWGEVCAAARTTGMTEYPKTLSKRERQQVLAFDRRASSRKI